MREAYRLNKLGLAEHVTEKNIRLNALFTLTHSSYSIYKELDFSTLNEDMKAVLEKIIRKI